MRSKIPAPTAQRSFSKGVQFYTDIDWPAGEVEAIDPPQRVEPPPMLSAHIASFLKLISAQLEETSRGIRSIHHFHNVQCGIANILSLLEYDNDVVEKADQLARRASSYITRHDLISGKGTDGDISEDADRLQAAHAALAGFRFAVEHSRPNARVHTLGLA
jgi:hypothetical protein